MSTDNGSKKEVSDAKILDKWGMRASGKDGRCGDCRGCSGAPKFGMNGCFSSSKHYSLNLPI